MAAGYPDTTNSAQAYMLTCPSKKMTHIDCPGCGFQRGTLAMLKGNMQASWRVYPPTGFIWVTILFLCVHLLFKLKYGAVILKYLYIVTVVVIMTNYIYKIFTNQLI
ncbi:hypothetical protein CAP35_03415 [Chitinophagaceae bacterium IBVUCB1]|nr:hypothetical protein CAP35_03415 [Chitinophagaceae bacterium IBVUCB1]